MRRPLVFGLLVLLGAINASGASADADTAFDDVFRIVHRRPDGVAEVTLMKKDKMVLNGKTTELSSKISKQFQDDLEKKIPLSVEGDVNCIPSGRWELTFPKRSRYFCRSGAAIRSLNEMTANLRIISSK